jgi:choline dehydrogenase
MADQFDYVIFGAGSTGSVIAGRLAEDPGTRVCVLEAGPPDRNMFIHIPAGFMKTFVKPSLNWMYETEPSPATGGRVIAAPRGKTLGGSSSINGHVYSRGQRADYDTWAQQGNHGWGFSDVLPYFKRAERRIGEGDDVFRGRDGGLTVTDIDWSHPLCEAFIAGANGLGIPSNRDYNGAHQDGVSYTQRIIHKHRRVSSYRGFLHQRRGQTNVDIRTGAHASKILLDGRRVTGIRYLQGGREVEVSARREVILCGGTVNSPQLLQLSGIGPGALLRDIGVDLVHELPGVGENLRDHFAVRMTARVKNSRTINELSRGLPLAGEVFKYFTGQPSILALAPTLVYAFWRSHDALDNGDIQVSFTPASYKDGVQNTLDDHPGMSIAAWQQRPDSRGHIRARSADPRDKPLIQPNYLAEESDRQTLFSAIRLGQRILRSPEMAPYLDTENTPELDIDSEDALWDLTQRRGTTGFHLIGTCRMGPSSDALAVVDDRLIVHGIDGLRVADASIMPTMPSSNTNAPTIMIGEKAADMISGKTPPAPVLLDD